LENKNKSISLGNFLAIALKEEGMSCQKDPEIEPQCSVCDTEIDTNNDDGVSLKNCKHVMHFKCLEELFD